jgi:hypothetical protein
MHTEVAELKQLFKDQLRAQTQAFKKKLTEKTREINKKLFKETQALKELCEELKQERDPSLPRKSRT